MSFPPKAAPKAVPPTVRKQGAVPPEQMQDQIAKAKALRGGAKPKPPMPPRGAF